MEIGAKYLRLIGLQALELMTKTRPIGLDVDVNFSLSSRINENNAGYEFSITIFNFNYDNCTFYFYELDPIEKSITKISKILKLVANGDFKKIYKYSRKAL